MSLMCLFLWFDYGDDISDFENLHFFVGQLIFTLLKGLKEGHFARQGQSDANLRRVHL